MHINSNVHFPVTRQFDRVPISNVPSDLDTFRQVKVLLSGDCH
jgi:hypothetical protein